MFFVCLVDFVQIFCCVHIFCLMIYYADSVLMLLTETGKLMLEHSKTWLELHSVNSFNISAHKTALPSAAAPASGIRRPESEALVSKSLFSQREGCCHHLLSLLLLKSPFAQGLCSLLWFPQPVSFNIAGGPQRKPLYASHPITTTVVALSDLHHSLIRQLQGLKSDQQEGISSPLATNSTQHLRGEGMTKGFWARVAETFFSFSLHSPLFNFPIELYEAFWRAVHLEAAAT